MDFIFPFLFLLIMGLVVFVLLKTASKRKERFALLARQAGLHMSGGGFSAIMLQGLHEGYPVTFTFTPSGKNTPPYMTTGYLCQLPITVTLRPQGIGTAIKTTFGLGRDLQIGDQTVDDAFEIDGDEQAGLLSFLGDVDVRRVLLNLHAHKLRELYITSQGLSLRREIDESELDGESLVETMEVLHWISVLVHRHGTGQLERSSDASETVPQPVDKTMTEPVSETVSLCETVSEAESEPEPEPEPESAAASDATSAGALLDQLQQDQLSPEEAALRLQGLGQDAISQVVQGLNDYQLREKLEATLLALGSAAVPALVAALEDSILAYQVTELLARSDADMQQGLVQALANISEERALTKALEVCTRCKPANCAVAIEPFLDHESFLVRYEAERALAAINED